MKLKTLWQKTIFKKHIIQNNHSLFKDRLVGILRLVPSQQSVYKMQVQTYGHRKLLFRALQYNINNYTDTGNSVCKVAALITSDWEIKLNSLCLMAI